jgi:hypothetical protein
MEFNDVGRVGRVQKVLSRPSADSFACQLMAKTTGFQNSRRGSLTVKKVIIVPENSLIY